MRRWCELALIAALSVGASPGHAQDITPEGLARTASAIEAITQFCGRYYVVDGPKAAIIVDAARKVVLEQRAGAAGHNLLTSELRRRRKEVESTGAPDWCQNQRLIQGHYGTGIFLN